MSVPFARCSLIYSIDREDTREPTPRRGAWVEHEDPELLAAVAEALGGLTIDDITRRPRRVIRRVLGTPPVAARLVADDGMLGRLVDAYTDSWEYDAWRSA